MKTGIFVCGRDINLPLPEWERLMWGEPPNKMGSLPMAVKITSDEELIKPDTVSLLVLGNGCIPGKNNPDEIGFTKRYFFKHAQRLMEFEELRNRKHGRPGRTQYDCTIFYGENDVAEVGRIVNNTAEEIVEATRLFSEAGITRIFMVSCGSQIARAMMAQIAAKEHGEISAGQQWFFVADDMFYSDTTATDVVVIEPPHRTDDPMFRTPLKTHEVMKRFFQIPWDKRVKLLKQFDTTLKALENEGKNEEKDEPLWVRGLIGILGKDDLGCG